MQLLIVAVLWVIWCVLHSLLVEDGVGRRVKTLLGPFAGSYRFLYLLFSILSLLVPLSYSRSLSPVVYYRFQGVMLLVPLVLLSYGVIMFYLGCRSHDMFSFFGVRGGGGEKDNVSRVETFRADGILARVRHPWYSSGFALIWAFGPLSDVSLTVKCILSLYLIVGTRLEEGRLRLKFGQAYVDYCSKVPRFIPRLR